MRMILLRVQFHENLFLVQRVSAEKWLALLPLRKFYFDANLIFSCLVWQCVVCPYEQLVPHFGRE